MLKHIQNKEQFDNEIANGLVLVDFFANWCGPCKMLSPILEEISEENPNLTIIKVDVDEVYELAAKFGVQSIPSLFLFKDGKLIANKLGYQNKNQLLAFINQ